MAERTIRPINFDDGAAYVEYTYDDVTGEVYNVSGTNTHTRDLWVSVRGTEDSGPQAKNVDYQYTFTAGSGTTSWDIPQGQRKKFTLEPDLDGLPGSYDTLAGLEVEARLI